MKSVTRGQMGDLVAKLAVNVDWGALDGEKLEQVNGLPPGEYGRRMTLFLASGCQSFEFTPLMLMVNRTKEIDTGFLSDRQWMKVWRGPETRDGLSGNESHDMKSIQLVSIDFSKVWLVSMDHDNSVDYNLHHARGYIGHILLDAWVGEALWNQEKQAILESFYTTYKITRLDFPGTLFRVWQAAEPKKDGGSGDPVIQKALYSLTRNNMGLWRRDLHYLWQGFEAGTHFALL